MKSGLKRTILALFAVSLSLIAGCTSSSSPVATVGGAANGDPIEGETTGSIEISVKVNGDQPVYSWSETEVVDFWVVRLSDLSTVIFGTSSSEGEFLPTSITHSMPPTGVSYYFDSEEEHLVSGIEYMATAVSTDMMNPGGSVVFTMVVEGDHTGSPGEIPADKARLSGDVVDDLNQILADVTITDDTNLATTTDAAGEFDALFDAGVRTFTATKEGYEPVQLSITMIGTQSYTWNPIMSLDGGGGAETTTLSGTVVNASSVGIPDAIIASDTGESAITNADGIYSGTFTTGTHTFTATRAGFDPVTTTMTLVEGTPATWNVTLTQSASGVANVNIVITDDEFNALEGVLLTLDDGSFTGTSNEFGGFTEAAWIEIGAGTRTFTFSKTGYQTLVQTEVLENGEYYSPSFVMSPDGGGETGTVLGYVVDAVSGEAIEGARLLSDDGSETTSGSSGAYSLTVESGMRTITASFNGYISSVASFTVATEAELIHNFNLSPLLTGDGIRLVLAWGATPEDLDSHLLTPEIEGMTHHIYYGNEGSSESAPYASLDFDATEGFGPETITIYQQFVGTYQYYIYNWSEDPDIAGSGANVAVYTAASPDEAALTLTVPEEGEGLYWHVLDIDGGSGEFTVVNEIVADEPTGFWAPGHVKQYK